MKRYSEVGLAYSNHLEHYRSTLFLKMVFKHAALATSFFLSSLIHLAAADTCESVQLLQTVDIRRRLQLEYTQEQTNYWSTNCGKLKPSCILYPSSAQEVASIVKVLNENEDPFVIKSGGILP